MTCCIDRSLADLEDAIDLNHDAKRQRCDADCGSCVPAAGPKHLRTSLKFTVRDPGLRVKKIRTPGSGFRDLGPEWRGEVLAIHESPGLIHGFNKGPGEYVTSPIRSEAPFMHFAWSTKFGSELTNPPNFTTRLTRSKSPPQAWFSGFVNVEFGVLDVEHVMQKGPSPIIFTP